ncbi:MAG: MBL fold metallo-hydrolase [Bacilli bacterium]|jgi:L-ascorbate metabolism protein UlaG (beta-lactamase superfamily)|nr:MBL fold metallo-hydrolase [Bacilli bacterium]
MLEKPITVFAHSAICLRGKYQIYIDPFHIPQNFHDADFVFITHPHWDHFSLLDILKVKKEDTNFIIPKEVYEELLDIGILEEHIKIVKPFESYSFAFMKFQTIPAYNREKNYHLKESNWMGYLITLDQIVYYIAGDTDIHPFNREIKADVVFLPVGGVYTMDAREAARLANLIHPHLAIPTHYLTVVGALSDAKDFRRYLHQGIACQIFYHTKEEENE